MYSVGSDGKKSHRVRLHFGLPCALLAMIVATGAAQTQDFCEEHYKLTASDATAVDLFGWSVSASGDTAMIGALDDRCAVGPHCGSAYVYRFDGRSWVQKQKLTASDAATNDGFGSSVSVDGNTALVGAYQDGCFAGPYCGSAYVFRFNGTSWIEEQKLTASDAGQSDSFGRSVSVSGETAVVGAFHDDCTAGNFCGSVYVFRFNGSNWVEEQKLTVSDEDAYDSFGRSVSVSGETIVVGRPGDACAAGNSCGSAYVFRFDGTSWVEEQKLTPSDAGPADRFGSFVSLSGDTVVVGATGDDCAAGEDCGSAYLFRFNGTSWDQEQKLTASDAAAGDFFGGSVSVNGDTAVVGVSRDDCTAGNACGSAYIFRFNGSSWVENQKLIATDAAEEDSFGGAVSVSANTVVVGAYHDDCGGRPDCGSAYVYDLDQPCAFCGNGRRDPREECDGGFGCMDCVCGLYLEPTVPLSIDCRPSCGDGELDGGEECDGGFACTNCVCDDGFVRTVPVSLDCQPKCGNGIFDLGEECDAGLGCTDCLCDTGFEPTVPPYLDCRSICGNEAMDPGEECDGGSGCADCVCGLGAEPSVPPSVDCLPCGNGTVDPGEQCDGGFGCMSCVCGIGFEPTVPTSLSCSSTCGNGSLDAGEECDVGVDCTNCRCDIGFESTVPPSIDCQPICGNGIADPGEQCDGGLGCRECVCDLGFAPGIPPFLDCKPVCERQKLTASDAAANDGFGEAVSLSGDTAIVGASGGDCQTSIFGCGSAYVYRFNGTSWVEEQRLSASDATPGDRFGSSVSVSGDTAVVGAPETNCGPGADCGSAYVFRFNGASWVEEQKLTPSDQGRDDLFGQSVSVSADTVVVGASGNDCSAGDDCGAAYVFGFNGTAWFEEQELTSSDAAKFDLFGRSVSVSGDTTVVGKAGSASVFRFNGTSWIQAQTLTASDATVGGSFGRAVVISEDTVVVGGRWVGVLVPL